MKRWYFSKTMWFNLIALVSLVLGSEQLMALVPEGSWPLIVQAQAVLNIVLRFVTNTGVKVSGGTK